MLKKSNQGSGHNAMQGVLISEESYSFILTFVSYNAATATNPIIADKVIETAFGRSRKIVVEFLTPVILTQEVFEDHVYAENLTEQTFAEKNFYPNGTYGYSMSPTVPAVVTFQKPIQLHYLYLKQHRSPQYFMKKSYGHHEIKAYLNGKLVL